MTRWRWLIVSAASGIFLAGAAGAVPFLNLRLTHYVESDRFRARLENETTKGLHFPSGHYAPIRRAGIVELFKQSPGAYLGLLLRELEAWLKRTFNGE